MKRICLQALPAVVFAGVALQAGAAPNAPELPTAQALLFDAAYLAPLAAPSRLTYRYSRKTTDAKLYGASLDDKASVRLTPSAGGGKTKDAMLALFTGARERQIGPLPKVTGNPIIMMFLEHDAGRMRNHVGGSMVYFRNVIRAALRNAAKVEPVEIDWRGKTEKAMKVTIRPFEKVPHAERLKLFRTKVYEFTVSEAVPGGIYDIHTITADGSEGQTAPSIDTHLTLTGIDYDKTEN